jgi:hypothetical protein
VTICKTPPNKTKKRVGAVLLFVDSLTKGSASRRSKSRNFGHITLHETSTPHTVLAQHTQLAGEVALVFSSFLTKADLHASHLTIVSKISQPCPPPIRQRHSAPPRVHSWKAPCSMCRNSHWMVKRHLANCAGGMYISAGGSALGSRDVDSLLAFLASIKWLGFSLVCFGKTKGLVFLDFWIAI